MDLAFCLETLYTTKPFLHRLEAARKDGIECIEIWDWQEKNQRGCLLRWRSRALA